MPFPNDNPASGFAFLVRIVGPASAALTDTIDGQFQEVSGIEARMVLPEEKAGGLNSFVHRLPRVNMAANLVLKRGLVTRQSALADWAAQSLHASLGAQITTRTIILSLVGHDGKAEMAWTFLDAYPVKWEVVAPDPDDGNPIITAFLEFGYSTASRVHTA